MYPTGERSGATSPDSRAEFGMTVFLTTHYLEEAIDCGKSHSSVRVALCAKVRRGRWWNNCGHILEVETDQPAQLAEHSSRGWVRR